MRAIRIIAFLLLPLYCFSQNKETVPLKILLEELSETHDVRFGYIEEELIVYSLIPPNPKATLDEKLRYIEQQTRLHFKEVYKNNYTIYNDRKMDKPLCGFLLDAETRKPIENAQITISGLSIATISGVNGYFELPVIAPNPIEVRHLSYKQKTISPQDLYVTNCPQITIEPIAEKLTEVVTQRYLATGIVKKASGELVVRPGKFGILPGLTDPDILQTMQQVPGINSIDETVSNINVRGGTHDQNLFLWNGIRMFQTGHFFGLISAFNPLLATNIALYKNGSPAFYGEGVSSMVNISTHTSVIDSCYNAIAVDMINANFLSKIRLSKNATIQVSGRRTFTDIFTSPTFKYYQKRIFQNTIVTDLSQNQQVYFKGEEEFYFYDFSLQYHQRIGERHEFIIDGIGIENAVDINQQSLLALRESNLAQQNFGGSLDWKTKWNDKHQSEFQTYFSWYNLDAESEIIGSNQLAEQNNRVFDKGFRLQHSFSFSEKSNWSAGYQLNEISVVNSDKVNAPLFSRYAKEVSVSHALIGDWNYQTEKTALRFGVRANYFDKYAMTLVEPRMVWTQKLIDKLKLEVIAEQKSQTLSQITELQQDFLGIENRRWILANESNIPVQKSKQASIGLRYAANGWLLTLDNFYKKVSGITSDSQGFRNQFEFVNATGHYNVMGSELLLQKSFSRFYSWVSYSYNDNRYDFDGINPNEFPNNYAISHAISAAAIYEWNQLRIALGAKWHTGRPITTPSSYIIDTAVPINSRIDYNTANNERLADYFQVNFSASKSWKVGKTTTFSASASVLNILNRNNILNRYYRISTQRNAFESVNTYSLGRTPNISLKLLF